jgi:hypothetical protein
MRKIQMLIGGLALMSTTLVSAAPRTTLPQPSTSPAAVTQTAQPLPWEQQQPQANAVCNLLCIQGDHCCIIHNQATCVPNSQACKG